VHERDQGQGREATRERSADRHEQSAGERPRKRVRHYLITR
jgi:hypothetical protein